MADFSISDRAFVLQALLQECRTDGRRPFDYRKIKLQLTTAVRSWALGPTRVSAVVTSALEAPYQDRPNEGSIRFNVEFSPMASPTFETGRPSEAAIEVTRLVERGLKESHAVDTEALCVLAGRKVWALRVDIHVLDHGGNLVDACSLAVLAALLVFRRPDASVGGPDGQAVTLHSPDVREPLQLSIHHLPLAITFAVFEDGGLLVIDPSLREEAAKAGHMTIVMNAHKEVCAVQKSEGIGLTLTQIMRCMRVAATKVDELTAQLREAVESHEVMQIQARVRRHAGPSAGSGISMPIGLGLEDSQDAANRTESSSSEEASGIYVAETDVLSKADVELEGATMHMGKADGPHVPCGEFG